MKQHFCFLILFFSFLTSESSAQFAVPVVRPERSNVFESEAENSESETDRVTVTVKNDTEAEQIVEEITEKLCFAVREEDIKSYLDCLSKEKREKDKVKIAKKFMMEKIPSLDVLKTFIVNESEEQIDFIAKYCANGEWIYISEIVLIKEDGRFVVSNEKVIETTSNSPLAGDFVERNAHLKGLDPNVPIRPCHMGDLCKNANEAGRELAEQLKRDEAKPFRPQIDVKPNFERPFNPNGNNFFVDDNGGIREVNSNGWVSVPKNGPQFVDLNQLKKFYPDRYSGCNDGNCANGKCKIR